VTQPNPLLAFNARLFRLAYHLSRASSLCLIWIVVTSFGCGGGGSSAPPVSVSVSPTSSSLQAGDAVSLTATVTNDTANRGVSWAVSCSAAPCGSVSPTASTSGAAVTYTAPANTPANNLTATITATAAADSTKSATATVTIIAVSVSVTPQTAAVQANAALELSATVTSDAANAGVTWTVTCPTAPCGSVSPSSSASGDAVTYSAPASRPASNLSVAVTATSVTDKSKSGSAAITIPSVGVSIDPASATVLGGATAKFSATVLGDSGNKGVAWTVTCAAAPCGSVSPTSTASGAATTYTAPPVPAIDLTVTITATSAANSLSAASAAISVPAVTVDIQPPSASVIATNAQQFTATVANDPNNKGVTWTVSCSTSSCGTLSSNATASGAAVTYTAPGIPASDLSVTITATSVTDATKSNSAAITIPAIIVNPISPVSGIIPVNATQQFSATVSNDPTSTGVNWTLTQNGTNCSPACGTVSPATTASGAPTTFTAPATLPTNVSVTINASAAADTTKTATATITLTNGTLKLIPAALNFTCKLGTTNPTFRPCPPPPQTIALTNTSATPLTINSISITGTNSTLFQESNDCGTSLNASSGCTVAVTFHPSFTGTFTASVSFDDSSADSPQQAALSGKATRFQRLGPLAAQSELQSTTQASVPPPTGSEHVGTRVVHFVDASRNDPYLTSGVPRELAMRVWYPTSLGPNAKCVSAAYASPAIWNYFAQLAGVRPFPVTTNSCWEAPIAAGQHPVIVFSPGFTATFTDYTFLTEDLASRGYIVAAVAHTYESTAVELRDGRMAKSVIGSHLGGPAKADDRSLSTVVQVRMLDLQSAVSELERLNSRDAAFAKKLDLSRIAVAGHSLGALSALLEVQVEPRFKAAILMDGFVPSALPSATKKPVLLMGAGREHWDTTDCRLWNNLAGPRLAVNLAGTEHAALGDWIWLTPNSIESGPMGPQQTMAAIREYIAAFLDAHLRATELEPARERLLSGAAAEFPDAAVVRQEQPLCGKP
jgi:dienelactone hydrolase